MKKPNYTQIPNIVIDDFMANLSGSAVKILMAICRKTIGWHKDTDGISYSQLRKLTGISSNNTIRQGITDLTEAGLIRHERDSGGMSVFDLNIDAVSINDIATMSENDTDSINNCNGTVSKTVHTKESSKETTQKKLMYTPEFELFWQEYPRRKNKGGAYKSWNARLKERVTIETLMMCVKNYKTQLQANGTEPTFTLHPSTFLNKDHRFEDFLDVKEEQTGTYIDKNGAQFVDGVKTGHWDGSRFIPGRIQEGV